MIQEVPYKEILKIRKEVMYPNKDLEFVKLPDDDRGIHMGYYVNGEVVSIVSLFLENNKLQFRKFATLENFQGKGYGSKLLEWIINYAKDMKFNLIWCNARKGKLDFYKKFGFNESDQTYSENGYDFIIINKHIS